MNENQEIDRERIVELVKEGKDSEYWKILKNQIEEWKKSEEEFLKSFMRNGIKPEMSEAYNRAVERIDYLEMFLTINEIIIGKNNTILDKAKHLLNELNMVLSGRKGFLSQYKTGTGGNNNGS